MVFPSPGGPVTAMARAPLRRELSTDSSSSWVASSRNVVRGITRHVERVGAESERLVARRSLVARKHREVPPSHLAGQAAQHTGNSTGSAVEVANARRIEARAYLLGRIAANQVGAQIAGGLLRIHQRPELDASRRRLEGGEHLVGTGVLGQRQDQAEGPLGLGEKCGEAARRRHWHRAGVVEHHDERRTRSLQAKTRRQEIPLRIPPCTLAEQAEDPGAELVRGKRGEGQVDDAEARGEPPLENPQEQRLADPRGSDEDDGRPPRRESPGGGPREPPQRPSSGRSCRDPR